MSTMTATEAKNKFGQLLEMAQKEPVRVQKNGRDVAVVLSPGEFVEFEAFRRQPKVRLIVEKLLADSLKKRLSLYEALAK